MRRGFKPRGGQFVLRHGAETAASKPLKAKQKLGCASRHGVEDGPASRWSEPLEAKQNHGSFGLGWIGLQVLQRIGHVGHFLTLASALPMRLPSGQAEGSADISVLYIYILYRYIYIYI